MVTQVQLVLQVEHRQETSPDLVVSILRDHLENESLEDIVGVQVESNEFLGWRE